MSGLTRLEQKSDTDPSLAALSYQSLLRREVGDGGEGVDFSGR